MPTSYQIFYDSIPKILESGPKTHREIAKQLQQQYPSDCDDSIPCPHREDSSIHPEWDHLARSAEQALKRKGIIIHNSDIKKWQIA